MNELYREICENLDWDVYTDSSENIELRKFSPAGENFSIYVGAENFVENVKKYAASFDADEHAEMWISKRGKGGVPFSIREILEDAQAIDDMLRELSCALLEAELEVVGA